MPEFAAKDILVAPIKAADANALVKRLHYSGKVVNNSQLHLGVFLGGRLEGAMQFGPSLDKRKIQGLVSGTLWNGFIELNRMAFSERLPRNSESRAIGVAMRLIRQHYPHIEWVISFADGTQCGDGTIYRASGFVLTGVKVNTQIWEAPSGRVFQSNSARGVSNCNLVKANARNEALKTLPASGNILETGASSMKIYRDAGWKPKEGFQLRYLYFLNPSARERLTVPILPFSKIEDMGAAMYRGEKITRTKRQAPEHPSGLGGSTPTRALHPFASEAGDNEAHSAQRRCDTDPDAPSSMADMA